MHCSIKHPIASRIETVMQEWLPAPDIRSEKAGLEHKSHAAGLEGLKCLVGRNLGQGRTLEL